MINLLEIDKPQHSFCFSFIWWPKKKKKHQIRLQKSGFMNDGTINKIYMIGSGWVDLDIKIIDDE